ncbi:DUF4304 domain-containing protein [Dokdonella fugitiva]|jgi:hypothetical protein|uniref:DUF4304 domain-containing protein n=1 Tax=Dokdonella fugitiva TaxID=328517 RepID=UPI00104357D5|nr:DUF4304 domain-containing protein [Dokdonella fugitiva]
MEKTYFQKLFGRLLREHGFMKQGSRWYRSIGEVLQIADLQKSNFGQQFYVNLCWVPTGMTVDGMPIPKEQNCPIRIRLSAAYPNQEGDISQGLDLENKLTDDERERRVAWMTRDLMLPLFERLQDNRSLRAEIAEGVLRRGAVNAAARSFLGIAER